MQSKLKTWFSIFLLLAGFCLTFVGNDAVAQTSSVQLIEPANNTRVNPGSKIRLRASVSQPEGIRHVEFIADGQVIGTATNEPYSMVWTNVSVGVYQLSARMISENGSAEESEQVRLRVYNAHVTFGLDRIESLERIKFFRIPLWQYCASLIYIFLAFYISKFLDFLTRVWLKRWAEKTTTKLDDMSLEMLNGPIKVISFVILLRIGLEVFSWPLVVRHFLSKAFTIVVALSITYTILRFVDLLLGYWREKNRADADRSFDEHLFPIIRKSLKLFVIVVASLVTLDNIGVNITAAIASLSIGGLAVGLAAQDTLANLFGAVSVFVDKPFKIGDFIQVNEFKGNVESIGVRSTRLRSPDGHLITIPNKTMGNAAITNVTMRPNIKTEINFGIAYDTPTEKVQRAVEILREIYKSHPMTQDLIISFNRFADSALNIFVIHWWKGVDSKAHFAGMQELNLTIKKRFDEEGIQFAFPSRTVYVKQDSRWELTNGIADEKPPQAKS
jgi:Small-conductance mechanosensitive channel